MAFRARGDTAAACHGTLAAFLLHDKMSSPDDDGRELAVIRLAKPFAQLRRIHARVATDGIRVAERSPAADIWVASKAMIRVTQIGRPFPRPLTPSGDRHHFEVCVRGGAIAPILDLPQTRSLTRHMCPVRR
ncbi:MAG: hypothetical protein ACXVA6_04910 [Isosphaeraceae bacterium]